jgi:tetratricopeptide (TPR) repeat protein
MTGSSRESGFLVARSGLSRGMMAAVLLLTGWGALKVAWEMQIRREQDALKYQGLKVSRAVRDQVGQGMMLGLFSGFKGVVADFVWLGVVDALADREWFRIKNRVELVTALQPRFLPFWEQGAWHLAWNASLDRRRNLEEPSQARRIRDERFWIAEGEEVLKRGLENNPERYNLYYSLGWLYQHRKRDYRQAAHYYALAAERPGAPTYLERFAGYMLEKAGENEEAYAYWRKLWNRPELKGDPTRAWDKIEKKIRDQENRLKIPPEKRIFPK